VDRYVVIGNPIAHSLSPDIHARFGAQTGDRIDYGRMLVAEGRFADDARAFFSGGGRGANVTLPFKGDAVSFADRCSARARLAGAANFLAVEDGQVVADNTDGEGLVNDLDRNAGFTLRGARILVLGAGGATRGVMLPLLQCMPAQVTVANRTVDRALALRETFAKHGPVDAGALAEIRGRFDLVLNATSASTKGETLAIDPAWFAPGSLAYDMAYGKGRGDFLARAAAAGAATRDGLGMLVEQAAAAFALWRGKRPYTSPVLAELRSRFP
jgi:shikimate dehydrogenase